jgi:hypothetical protein
MMARRHIVAVVAGATVAAHGTTVVYTGVSNTTESVKGLVDYFAKNKHGREGTYGGKDRMGTNKKQNQERSQNVVLYNLASIKNTINIIKEEYSDGVLEPLAKELYSSVSTGTEQLLKDYQKTIDTIDKSNVSDDVKKQRKADVQKKINGFVQKSNLLLIFHWQRVLLVLLFYQEK